MWEIQIVLTIIFAVLGTIMASVPTVGKCNTTNIVPVSLPTKEMEKHVNWRSVFATDFESVEDHESYMISMKGGRNYKSFSQKVMKDTSRSTFNADVKYIDNVLVQESVDNGERRRYYLYPLDITHSLATLYYYCSDVGDANVNYRAIVAPKDMVPSEWEYQQLLACDKRIFGENLGTLTRLPHKIVDDD